MLHRSWPAARTLCDAGCGLGCLSAALSPADAIAAADISDAALDVLRETIRTQHTDWPACDLLQSAEPDAVARGDLVLFGHLRGDPRDAGSAPKHL